jgi:hypothetical protein
MFRESRVLYIVLIVCLGRERCSSSRAALFVIQYARSKRSIDAQAYA